jgi:SAM-dependent methyltransferase
MSRREQLETMVAGYRDAMTLVAALKTGIFENLGHESRPVRAVAAELDLDERAVDIVLHALAAAGVLRKEGEAFAIEPDARPYLLADSPETLVSILGHNVGLMHNWLQLPTVLKTGRPAARAERTPAELRDFICGMENVSRDSSREVVAKVDLSTARRLLDLGGGPATAAIVFCQTHPDLEALVFDLPGPVEIAIEQIAAAGLTDRITTQAGDFQHDDLGTGFDVVYISNIIHMLSPDETRALLQRCRSCLVPGGRVLVKDFYLADNRLEPAFAAQFSVNMLTATEGGKSYTQRETVALLAETGFAAGPIVPVAKGSRVICGILES